MRLATLLIAVYFMTPAKLIASESVNRCAQALAAFRSGIDNSQTIAVHGTSIETLRLAIRTGIFPGGAEGVLNGRFYLFPNPDNPNLPQFFLAHELRPEAEPFRDLYINNNLSLWGAVREAGGYAEDIAFARRVETLIKQHTGKDIDPELLSDLRVEWNPRSQNFPNFPEAWTQLARLGLERTEARNIFSEAGVAKGLVISFDTDLFSLFPPKPADPGDSGIWVDAASGIPFELIRGIEPMGDSEYDELNQGISNLVDND